MDVGVGLSVWDAYQLARNTETERDILGADVLLLQEIHVSGRQAHLFPIKITLKQKRLACIIDALEPLSQIVIELLALSVCKLDGHTPVIGWLEHNSACWPRPVPQQSDVVLVDLVVVVDIDSRRHDWRQAIIVIQRIPHLHVLEIRCACLWVNFIFFYDLPAQNILITAGQRCLAWLDPDTIRPQQVKLPWQTSHISAYGVAVATKKQERIQRLKVFNPRLLGIWALQ